MGETELQKFKTEMEGLQNSMTEGFVFTKLGNDKSLSTVPTLVSEASKVSSKYKTPFSHSSPGNYTLNFKQFAEYRNHVCGKCNVVA